MAQNMKSRLACSNGHNAKTTRTLRIIKLEAEIASLLPLVTTSKKPNSIQIEFRNKLEKLQFQVAELKAIKSRV